ncbi:MFS transporter [Glutamicibacter ectropisis]|uniref:Putative proline/betaine transporter n=1 Tax=Glutamicibacter ectropisis TaxID=3046593 RepID=A0AAU6WCU3_9MICC
MSTSSTPAVGGQTVGRDRRTTRKNLLGIGMGNLLEWYDWNVYASFAVYIAAHGFNNEDKTSALLAALGVFAVGFIARPFGGFVFGWIGDRKGRKFSMTLAILLASLGSAAIALMPNYQSVGIWSSIMLLVARLVQGLAHGGELPSSQVFLSEVAPSKRRGLWSSWIYVSGTAGILVGVLMAAVLNMTLSAQQLDAFGWRIPFALGALAGLYTLYLRRSMEEPEAFKQVAEQKPEQRRGIVAQVWEHRRSALQVIGMTVGVTVAYYAWAINAPTFANTQLGMDRGLTLWAGVIGNIVLIAALPLWGMLSDRLGRKPVMIISAAGTLVLYYPIIWWQHNDFLVLVLSVSIMSAMLAGALAIMPALFSELFPPQVRTSGIGFPYAFAVAAFGGTAPYVQTLASSASFNFFPVYTMALLVLSILTVLSLPETKGKDLNAMAG